MLDTEHKLPRFAREALALMCETGCPLRFNYADSSARVGNAQVGPGAWRYLSRARLIHTPNPHQGLVLEFTLTEFGREVGEAISSEREKEQDPCG